MKAGVSQAFQPPSAAAADARSEAARPEVNGGGAAFWLDALFRVAGRAPSVLALIRKPVSRGAFRFSRDIQAGTLANAARILGNGSTLPERRAFARRVVEHFILFCADIGRSMRMTPDKLFGQIEQIEGHEHYAAARAMKRGAIVVTAHMGSFEVGMAALRRQDARIHVVFRRDAFGRFEAMRSALRAKLGVVEAPVDDGWTVWMRLRDALLADEVVVLQGDRVMPGQKGQPVDVLGTPMMLPTGPAKLALATGAPVVPVFCVRTPNGKVKLCVEPAITVDAENPAGVDRAMEQVAAVISKYIRAHGEQWLMLQPAWQEDVEKMTIDETGMTNQSRMPE